MNMASMDEKRGAITRYSDNHYSPLSIAQRSSLKAQDEGQNHTQATCIKGKDFRREEKSSRQDEKTQRRHSLGVSQSSLPLARSGTLAVPKSYGARRRHSEVISPLSFRVLRQENDLQTNEGRDQLNSAKSEEKGTPQNGSSLASRGRSAVLLNPSERSCKGADKTPKSLEQTEPSKSSRKNNQKSYPKTKRLPKVSAEEQRNELDQRIKLFNQNMDHFNKNTTARSKRKISLEKPTNTIVKAEETHRPLSLPVVFQSYSDLDFQRLSPTEKNSFASLRHCRYLRIPAPPELTIREIFQNQNKNRVGKETKCPRK